MPPDPRRAHQPTSPLPADGSNKKAPRRKKDRRAVLVECDSCGVHGTGSSSSSRLTSCNLPTTFVPGHLLHAGCGGVFRAFDIAGGGRRGA